MKISYREGSLFDAPIDEPIGHAVNCMGVWGAGIALEFKRRFPQSFKHYKRACAEHGRFWLGHVQWLYCANERHIANLFTSIGYGRNRAAPSEILSATRAALEEVQRTSNGLERLHLPRINSGNFGVPWPATEEVLRSVPGNLELIIWTPKGVK